jgi:hypothetical protein
VGVRERRLRAGANVAPRTREALGFRPGPLRGSATVSWLDWGGARREIAVGSQVPGSTDQGFKTPRRSAERRCRVPLFLGNPGNKPRLLPRCAFRRSASLFLLGGGSLKPPFTRRDLRARMTLARAVERRDSPLLFSRRRRSMAEHRSAMRCFVKNASATRRNRRAGRSSMHAKAQGVEESAGDAV